MFIQKKLFKQMFMKKKPFDQFKTKIKKTIFTERAFLVNTIIKDILGKT